MKTFSEKITNMVSERERDSEETRYVRKINGKWRVISAKTGEPWPAEYKSADDAKAALAAYHIHKGC